MIRPRALVAALLLAPAAAALAEGEPAGDFDYWVLSLSWSPSWCAARGAEDGADQCDPAAGFGWILHGLWPQYDSGWPSWCGGAPAPPTRRQTAAMADVMGSAGLAWHQWKKHGTCSGLAADDYFALARAAFDRVARPARFRRMTAPARIDAAAVEQAFLDANPGLRPDMLSVICRDGRVAELRICLARDGRTPRRCGRDVARDCTLTGAAMPPIP